MASRAPSRSRRIANGHRDGNGKGCARSRKKDNGACIGGHVHKFRMGAGFEEVKTKNADKKTPPGNSRRRADETVVKPDDQGKQSPVNELLRRCFPATVASRSPLGIGVHRYAMSTPKIMGS